MATYDGRGNIQTETDSGVVVSGVAATTQYQWNPNFDFLTQEIHPLGEQWNATYDGSGNRSWEQVGPLTDSTRRIHYQYYTSGDTAGLYAGTLLPISTAPTVATYDLTLGNIAATQTARGFWTLYTNDAVGRNTVVTMPIDSVNGKSQSGVSSTGLAIHHTYDQMDRETQRITEGPATTQHGADNISVTTTYEPGGLPLTVTRSASPDYSNIGSMVDKFVYDAIGRMIIDTAVDKNRDSIVYDAAGNADTTFTRRGSVVTMIYDAVNRLVQRIVPSVTYSTWRNGLSTNSSVMGNIKYSVDDTLFGGLTIPADTELFAYDAAGHTLTGNNSAAQVSRQYDLGGRLITETQAVRTRAPIDSGGSFAAHLYSIGYAYDLESRRTAIVHPFALAVSTAHDSTKFGYDPTTGWLNSVTDPLGVVLTYEYNARGEPDTLNRPNGIYEGRTWDNDGNLVNYQAGNRSPLDTSLRNEQFWYDARAKILTSANKQDPWDTVTTAYSGIGAMTSNLTVWYGLAVWTADNGLTVDGFGGSRILANYGYGIDGFGNQVRDSSTVTITSGYSGPDLESGGQTSTYINGPDTVTYQAGTGRQITDTILGVPDTTWYDAGGNKQETWCQCPFNTGNASQRVSYFAANNQIAGVEYRTATDPGGLDFAYGTTHEEYRYDAFGRRIWVHAYRRCVNESPISGECNTSFVRRTVWDGMQELDEVQVPDSTPEYDTNTVVIQVSSGPPINGYDVNLYYGRVLYSFGLTIDEPLSVVRLGYISEEDTANTHNFTDTGLVVFPAFTILPIWNAHGQMDNAFFNNGQTTYCVPDGSITRCALVNLSQLFLPYNQRTTIWNVWHGTLLEQKRDKVETLYERARAYDPVTGQFTQEDPIGLEGGVNAYGFANGDPVNYSDPFGLAACGDESDAGGATGDSTKKKPSPVACTYAQSSGELSCKQAGNSTQGGNDAGQPVVDASGYSGAPGHQNKSADQDLKNQGPIPQGAYRIEPAFPGLHHNMLNVMRLTPFPGTNTFGRGSFEIHGDRVSAPGTASEGCIVTNPTARSKVRDGGTLVVTP